MKKWIIGGLIAFAAFLAYMFGVRNLYISNYIVYICLFIMASHGWNLLGGYIGEISFGHAVFWGIGAYTVALPVGYGLGIPQLVLVFLGGITAAVFALIISYPLLKIKGFPFLIGTYGLAVVFEKIFTASDKLFATRGVFLSATNTNFLYPLIFGMTIVVTIVVKWLMDRRPLGLRFKSVRDVPLAAEMVGINLYRTKATALVLGAFITGLAGGFYALYSCFVNPSGTFEFGISIAILLGPYIGGIGTVMGAVTGTALVILLQEWARAYIPVNGGHHLVLGVLLVVIMLASKKGLYPGLVKLFGIIFKGRGNKSAGGPAAPVAATAAGDQSGESE